MFAVEIFPLLIFLGMIMSVLVVLKQKFALTIALTIVSLLLIFAFVMLPLRAKAETVGNWCEKDRDCVLLSVCNVILASSKSVAKANDQYSFEDGVYYSKVYKDCDPKYANITEPDHRNLISKCVKSVCVLKKKK